MDNLMEFLSLIGNTMTRPVPVHINRMMLQVSDQLSEEVVDCIEDKLDPLLEEIVELGPGNYHHHPSINKVFKWLVDPQRTPQEFNYIVGPAAQYKFCISGRFKNLYVGMIAAEALAVKSPVLKESWKHAAWFIVWLNSEYRREYNYGIASDILSDWIIRVIGDPVLCPNPALRLELMNMFARMVDVNADNGTQAMNAIMSACNSFDFEDRDFLKFVLSDRTDVNLSSITSILEKFIPGGHLLIFDKYLSLILKSQVSNIIRDVSCSYGMNPNRYTGGKELNMVVWFSRITLIYTHLEIEHFNSVQFYPDQENRIEDVTNALLILISNFKKSCQLPRLVNNTASCVLNVLELVLLVNIARMNELGKVYPKTLHTVHKILEELCDVNTGCNIVLSLVGIVLNRKYQDRLSFIQHELGKFQPESNMICSLLYHCNLIELS